VHQTRKVSRIAAVIIPWHACSKCRAAVETEFEKISKEPNLDYVYLQDTEEDRFLIRARA
ncbi:MAG: hypothetical protein WBK66_02295, partial [Bacillota bacterium]